MPTPRPRSPLGLAIGAAVVTVLVIIGIFAGPAISTCLNGRGAFGSCIAQKVAETGWLPGTAATVQADIAVTGPVPTEAVPVDIATSMPAVEAPLDATPVGPQFGLLRAEPDGSMVVAGSGIPGTELELWADDTLLGTTVVEASGDWVIVPDQPVPPGGVELTLGEAGKTRVAQSYVVVINDDKTSEPLVVASVPGEASDILQGLEPPVEVASVDPEAITPTPDTTTAETSVGLDTELAVEPPVEPDAVEPDMLATEPEAGPETETVADEIETPAVEAETELAETPVEEPATDVAVTDPEPMTTEADAVAETDTAEVAVPEETETDVALVEPDAISPEPEFVAPTMPPTIDAIELDGQRTFFAGAGPEGWVMRLYVDDAWVADATVAGGRWLVEGGAVLTNPSQRVRVDMLKPETADVVARAEVNFVIDLPPEVQPEVEQPIAVAEADPAPEIETGVPLTEDATELAEAPVDGEPLLSETQAEDVAVAETETPIVEEEPVVLDEPIDPELVEESVVVAEVEPTIEPEPEDVAVVEPLVEAPDVPAVEVAEVEPETPADIVEPEIEVAVVPPQTEIDAEPETEVALVEPEIIVPLSETATAAIDVVTGQPEVPAVEVAEAEPELVEPEPEEVVVAGVEPEIPVEIVEPEIDVAVVPQIEVDAEPETEVAVAEPEIVVPLSETETATAAIDALIDPPEIAVAEIAPEVTVEPEAVETAQATVPDDVVVPDEPEAAAEVAPEVEQPNVDVAVADPVVDPEPVVVAEAEPTEAPVEPTQDMVVAEVAPEAIVESTVIEPDPVVVAEEQAPDEGIEETVVATTPEPDAETADEPAIGVPLSDDAILAITATGKAPEVLPSDQFPPDQVVAQTTPTDTPVDTQPATEPDVAIATNDTTTPIADGAGEVAVVDPAVEPPVDVAAIDPATELATGTDTVGATEAVVGDETSPDAVGNPVDPQTEVVADAPVVETIVQLPETVAETPAVESDATAETDVAVIEPEPEVDVVAPAVEPEVAVVAPETVAEPEIAIEEPIVVAEVAEDEIPTMVAVATGDPEMMRFVSGKAIIRRGDNLWTIARRVYGEGLKYTMIWTANTDQIRNPNMIYPGQVFELPEQPSVE